MKTHQVKSRVLSRLVAAPLGFTPLGQAAIVNNCDEASWRAALAEGDLVSFACDGTIVLTNTIVIGEDTTIDASGHSVTLSGGNAVRIFDVLSNVSLSLNNLRLV